MNESEITVSRRLWASAIPEKIRSALWLALDPADSSGRRELINLRASENIGLLWVLLRGEENDYATWHRINRNDVRAHGFGYALGVALLAKFPSVDTAPFEGPAPDGWAPREENFESPEGEMFGEGGWVRRKNGRIRAHVEPGHGTYWRIHLWDAEGEMVVSDEAGIEDGWVPLPQDPRFEAARALADQIIARDYPEIL